MSIPESLLLGTSSFSSKDWYGVFYPEDLPEREMLRHYATRYRAVEVDSTFYGCPTEKTVLSWKEKTPPGFQLSPKMPQIITHDKCMVDCADDLKHFLKTMDLLEDRLGPILLQFRYFKMGEMSGEDFTAKLAPFLELLPRDRKFAVEVRNKPFVTKPYLDLLRKHGVAFTLIDHPWFERPGKLLSRFDVLTADFTYVRWLGDRYKIEEVTKSWDKVVVDREREMDEWAKVIAELLAKNVRVYAFANNHYSGHAPAALTLFESAFAKHAP
jgi:uncharacterized protein YecE (DUF72 family)